MKKTNKILSVILALILAFSSIPLMASAAAIDDDVKTLEQLIQPEKLGNLVSWLLQNLNNRKDKITGTVLRIVFLTVKDDSIDEIIADTDIYNADDETLAKILVSWLNKMLPEWTKELTGQSWWSDVTKAVKILGITLDLNSVDGIIKTLYSLANTSSFGDISKMNESAIKGVNVKDSGELGVVYALFQFLSDNTEFFKKALKGELDFGFALMGIKNKVNDLITSNIGPDSIKKLICDNMKMNDEVMLPYDSYKNHTVDELIGSAFIKVLTDRTDEIKKEEAAEVMSLSFNGFFTKYASDIYTKLLVKPLNEDLKELLVEKVKPLDNTGTLDKVFNWDYEFKDDTFDAILKADENTNIVAQLNGAVCALLKVILNEEVYAELNFNENGNEYLNENLDKAFRYVLPLIKDFDLGVDLSAFTKEAVEKMTSEEMAVGVLKLFFPGWFKNSKAEEINSAKTLEQLGVLAAYYAITNTEWVKFPTKDYSDKIAILGTLSETECIDLCYEIGMEVAAKFLAAEKDTYFTLPEDVTAWTGADYHDEIVDWAIEFISGVPAISDVIPTTRGELDSISAFDKLNLIFASIIDLSFISGCANEYFSVDIETMLIDKFFGNLLNFDIENAVSILAENESTKFFDKQINSAVIDIVDDLLTGLFEYNLFGHEIEIIENKEPNCTEVGWETYLDCSHCELTTKNEIPALGHTLGEWEEKTPATTEAEGLRVKTCSVCKAEVETESIPKLVPEYNKGDIDGNGSVTAADARIALRIAVKLDNEKNYNVPLEAIDVDGNGSVTAADARIILRVAVKLESF